MTSIVILTNAKQYPYHTPAFSALEKVLSKKNHIVVQLDIDSYKYDHQCLAKLKELEPDILITLDLAGFRFRTQSGENALNMLFTKNLNIIWGNKSEYRPLLAKKISLSMLFYDASGLDCALSDIYPNLLYYKSPGKLSANEDFLNTPEEKLVFQKIWADFTKEALPPET